MAKLIYSTIFSLDGFVADENGKFDWARPDEELHAFVNDLERPVGIYLYGRRMYETMLSWETIELDGQSTSVRDFATLWRSARKIVYSKTLSTVSSETTTIEREFNPDAVRGLKARAERDLTVGGAELAGQALAAGLVDELHLFVTPILVGGGRRSLPGGVRIELELLDEHRFGSGVIYLRYGTTR